MKEIKIGIIENYNQKGEGVIFFNNKPFYIFGTIVGETIEWKIIEEYKTYGVGEIIKIIDCSKHRILHNIDNAKDIGGYELIHMDSIAQKNFKIQRVVGDFKKIAKFDLKNEEIIWIEGNKKIKYRNKITLNNGCFYKKNSKTPIEINDFLLSDITWDKNLKGKIIYRKLDTLIFGKKQDRKYTSDNMLGYIFRIGLNSFYQINKEIAEKAYSIIRDNVIKMGRTLDLYSGIGVIAIIVSRYSSKVVAIERNNNSYQDAIFNIEKNKISNVTMIKDDVLSFVQSCAEYFDTIVLDPAREGVDKETIEKICLTLKPKRIIYMSCNPATQARDTLLLKEHYKIQKFYVLDMFPQTYHIETIIIFDIL